MTEAAAAADSSDPKVGPRVDAGAPLLQNTPVSAEGDHPDPTQPQSQSQPQHSSQHSSQQQKQTTKASPPDSPHSSETSSTTTTTATTVNSGKEAPPPPSAAVTFEGPLPTRTYTLDDDAKSLSGCGGNETGRTETGKDAGSGVVGCFRRVWGMMVTAGKHRWGKGKKEEQVEKEEEGRGRGVRVVVSEEERRLVRKIDWYLMPALWVVALLSYMDRSNIANAKVAGMDEDLHMYSSSSSSAAETASGGTPYYLAVVVFQVGYVLSEVPSNMILSRCRPSRFLACIMLLWGVTCAAIGGVQSWQQLVGARLVLGVVEAGFSPAVMYLISSWYRPREQSKRFLLFPAAGCVAGAFGGVVAGAVTGSMDGLLGIAGWRWLFVVEGAVTVCLAVAVPFILLDYPLTTSPRKLDEEERRLAYRRLLEDGVVTTGSTSRGPDGGMMIGGDAGQSLPPVRVLTPMPRARVEDDVEVEFEHVEDVEAGRRRGSAGFEKEEQRDEKSQHDDNNNLDKDASSPRSEHAAPSAEDENRPLHPLRALWINLSDWRIWLLSLGYMTIIGALSVTYFYPSLIEGMGYSPVSAEYMTAPLYLFALVLAVPLCVYSDRLAPGRRPLLVSATVFLGGCLACVVLAAMGTPFFSSPDSSSPSSSSSSSSMSVAAPHYLLLSLLNASLYAASPLALALGSALVLNGADVRPETRAVGLALVNACGHLAQLGGTYMFTASGEGEGEGEASGQGGFRMGFAVCAGVLALGAAVYAGGWWAFRRWPRKRG